MDNIKYNEDKESYIVFANNLKRYLKERGITQTELGNKVGVSQGTICDWLKTRTYPRMDKVEAIANFLGIEKSELIEEHNVNNKYFRDKTVLEISQELRKDPQAMALWIEIKKLSPHNREIVETLINSLNKEVK